MRTTGPTVTCRPHRLVPERLIVAKAEYDSMSRDGTAQRDKDHGIRPYSRAQGQRLEDLLILSSPEPNPTHTGLRPPPFQLHYIF